MLSESPVRSSAGRRDASRSFAIRQESCCDVAVVGGGTTGIAAALAAARAGARTTLIEEQGFLGGNATNLPGWVGFHDSAGRRVVGGIAWEMIQRLQQEGGATPAYPDPICCSIVGINPHWLKLIAADLTTGAGVDVRLHNLVVDLDPAERDGTPRPEALYIMTRGGLHRCRVGVVVDCTDTGAICRMAGARLKRGRASDGKVQVSSWTFSVGGVDWSRTLAYFRDHPDDIRPFPLADAGALLRQMNEAEVFILGAFGRLIRRAREQGMALPRNCMPGVGFRKLGTFVTVATRIEDVDPAEPASRTAAELEGMRQARYWMRFLRGYVPGFEDCFLAGSPSTVGVRETSHVEGDYTLTADDLMQGRRFDDTVALGGYHLDVHSPDHDGIDTQSPPAYGIPLRSLIPRGAESLLVAGRAISATAEAMASTRVIPIGMAMGQAAGLCAAMAVHHDATIRRVSIDSLRRRLADDGALLAPAESFA